MRKYLSAIALAFGAMVVSVEEVYAQEYPNRPVTIVVPSPPGGNVDRVARIITPKLSELWGQPVVIENVAGAANLIGTRNVAQAAPDGYRLLMGSLGPNALTPLAMRHVGQDAGYDPEKDLTPIVNLTSQAFLLLVRTESPYQTLEDLVTAMRREKNTLNYATSGYGAVSHYVTEHFKHEIGGEVTMIPYGGDAQSQAGLLGGEADMYFTVTSSAAGLIESGRARPLLVTSRERSPRAPEALSLTDAHLAGPNVQIWIGLFGPAGIPQELVDRINADARTALQDPKVKDALESGQEILTGDSASYVQFVRDQLGSFEKGIAMIDFKPNE